MNGTAPILVHEALSLQAALGGGPQSFALGLPSLWEDRVLGPWPEPGSGQG